MIFTFPENYFLGTLDKTKRTLPAHQFQHAFLQKCLKSINQIESCVLTCITRQSRCVICKKKKLLTGTLKGMFDSRCCTGKKALTPSATRSFLSDIHRQLVSDESDAGMVDEQRISINRCGGHSVY
jgi:hypothetical protein